MISDSTLWGRVNRVRAIRRFGVISCMLLGGCSGSPGGDSEAADPVVEGLSSTEHLTRASMMIRGLRPSVADLEAVRADPDQLPALVDVYLDSEAFGATIRDLHAELYLLRTDTTFQLPTFGTLESAGYEQDDLHHSTVEAPLRFVEEIVAQDEPYTNILTAQYAYANDVVAMIYGLPFDPSGPEWQRTQWTDGRPHAGLLSDSEIWRRHVSNAQNFHRGRANFVSKTFLCEDIAARDVVVEGGVAINDPLAVAEAVNNQASCIGCHKTLDPLAAFFWGYKEQLKRGAINAAYNQGCVWDWDDGEPPRGSYRVDHWCYPLRFYVVTDEPLWQEWGLPAPGYFGQPADDMTDLGHLISEDPRFALCTARTFYGYLGQVDRMEIPLDQISDYQQVLETTDFNIKELVKSIVLSDAFGAARVLDDPSGAFFTPGLQVIRPEQYERMVEDLTGFLWVANEDKGGCTAGGNTCWNTVNIGNSDLFGFRSMQGGVDGYTVTHPTHTATPTKALAMAMHADEAAGYVVENDLQLPPGERKLLGMVEASTTDEALIRAQLAWLHLRILGEFLEEDGEEVDGTLALYQAVQERSSNSTEAWKVVIAALLQDPRMTFY